MQQPIGLPDEITSQIANADQATIRELLTMTSGIPEYLNEDFYNTVAEDPNHDWTAAEALTFAYGLPASFAPSDGFEYCNSNYVLLQLIVEAATEPMHEVMREQIFVPLGLTNTYVQAREQGAAFITRLRGF